MFITIETLTTNDLNVFYSLVKKENNSKNMRFNKCDNIKKAKVLLDDILQYDSVKIILDDQMIGYFTMKNSIDNLDDYSISVLIDEQYWSCGYFTQVLQMYLEQNHTRLINKNIYGYVLSHNIGSIKVLLKNNFELLHIKELPDIDSTLNIYHRLIT